jgi:aquaporin Z
MFGEGTPFAQILPSVDLRRAINGFLFGSIGAAIALSPVGKVSGAHINPVVTLAFLLAGRLDLWDAGVYVLAQLAGAAVGCLPLLAWGAMGRSIAFGATTPGKGYSIMAALMGEVVTTFGLVAGLCVFLAFRNLRGFTPAMIPFFYAFIVPLEAPISGTSTNPARSLGPAIISGEWHGWWIYWIGPVIGAFIAVFASSRMAKRIEVAKLYYFETDRRGAIHKLTGRA